MKNSLKIGAVFGAVIVSGSLSLTAASFANADISPVATVAVAQSPEQPVSSGGGRQLDNQVIPGTAWFEIPADQLGDGPGEQSVPRDDGRGGSALAQAGLSPLDGGRPARKQAHRTRCCCRVQEAEF